MHVELRVAARHDLVEGELFYEAQRKGLGDYFSVRVCSMDWSLVGHGRPAWMARRAVRRVQVSGPGRPRHWRRSSLSRGMARWPGRGAQGRRDGRPDGPRLSQTLAGSPRLMGARRAARYTDGDKETKARLRLHARRRGAERVPRAQGAS